MFKIKNWDKFQHYKHKNKMSWYKMYGGDILNDVLTWNCQKQKDCF